MRMEDNARNALDLYRMTKLKHTNLIVIQLSLKLRLNYCFVI